MGMWVNGLVCPCQQAREKSKKETRPIEFNLTATSAKHDPPTSHPATSEVSSTDAVCCYAAQVDVLYVNGRMHAFWEMRAGKVTNGHAGGQQGGG